VWERRLGGEELPDKTLPTRTQSMKSLALGGGEGLPDRNLLTTTLSMKTLAPEREGCLEKSR
jgi:hypothetical protein